MSENNAFLTHNGLKVRLDQDYCMQYLEKEKALPWLISIEAFDTFSSFLSIIGTIILLFTHQSPFYAGIVIMALYLFGILVSQSFFLMGLFNLIYGLIFMLYEKLMRLFIPYIALAVITFITKEYLIFVAFLIVRFACFILTHLINIIRGKMLFSKYGVYIGDVEMTAIKLLNIYSNEEIVLKKWLENYSNFLKLDADEKAV